MDPELFAKGKSLGFSDRQIAHLTGRSEDDIRAERKKLHYIITPEGIALRARLTVDYIEQQFLLYRNTRQRVREHVESLRKAGFTRVSIRGDGDVADICRLTCLEQGFEVVNHGSYPVLEIAGLSVILHAGGSDG